MLGRIKCSSVSGRLRFLLLTVFTVCLWWGESRAVAQTTTWTFDGAGDWVDPANWDNGEPNGSTFDVIIDDGDTASEVTLTLSRTIGDLTLGGDDLLNLTGGNALRLDGGDFDNNGILTINSNGVNADTELVAGTSLTIDGTGEIVLNNAIGPSVPQRASIDAIGGATITQGAGHTIRGRGRITAALVNDGIVSADAGGLLQLATEDKTNNNIFEATNGGELRIDTGIQIDNSLGVITADNGTVSIRGGSEIVGGNIESLNGGAFAVDNGVGIFDGVTSDAVVNVTGSDMLQLENSFTNNGTVTINSDGVNADTELVAGTSLTIDGTGEIVLNNVVGPSVPQRASIDAAAGETITQGADHTIRGNGRITAALINDGVVSADAGGLLQLATENKTNNNIFEATNGSELRIDGVQIANGSGTITADDGTVSVRSGSEIVGGNIASVGVGTFEVDNGVGIFDGVTSAADVNVTGNDMLQLENSFTNNGTVTINSDGVNADTELVAGTSLTIDGTGEIVLNNVVGPSVPQRASIDAALGATITQGADHTIRGNGRITAALINDGVVSADAGGLLQLATENKTNNNIFEATNGSELRIDGVQIANGSGTITADDGTVSVRSGSEIVGGNIASVGVGTFEVDNGVGIFDGVTSAADVNVTGNDMLQLENSFTNNGTVTINSDGVNADTELVAGTSLTIDGTGEIVLNNVVGPSVPQRASIDATAGETITQASDHTIRGRGRITAALINDGVVSAEGGLLQLRDGDKTNNGTFQALDGGTLETISGTNLTNFSGGVLTGGTYRSIDGGAGAAIEIFEGPATEFGSGTEVVLSGANSSLTFGGTAIEDSLATNQGVLRILNNRDFDSTVASFDNSGVIELGGGTLDSPGIANSASGELFGFGNVADPVSNNGLVRASGGTLAVNSVSGTGTVQVDAASALDISSSALDSSAGNLFHNGDDLNLGTNDILVSSDYNNANFGVGNQFNARANVTGSGQILADPATTQTVTGDVANGTQAAASLDFGNVRVGDTETLNFAVNNAGASGPALRGALQTDGSAGNGGNVTDSRLTGTGVTAQNFGAVAPTGATTDFEVTFDATTAGTLAGQQVAVVNNFDNVDNQTIGITGAAFNVAQAQVTPTTVDFGIVHVGDVLSPTDVLVENLSPSGQFSEDLRAENYVAAGDVSLTGGSPSSVVLAAGDNATAAAVQFDTSSAGFRSGNLSVDLVSTGTVDGIVVPDLDEFFIGTEVIEFLGTVNNFAAPDLLQVAGGGSFSETAPNEYLLDFGTLLQNDPSLQVELGLLNDIAGPADFLTGDFQLGGSPFTFSGFGSVGDLAAGDLQDGLFVGFNPNAVGTFSTSIFFDPLSENASGFSGSLDQIEIVVQANVSAVPEPNAIVVLMLAMGGATVRRRRR